MIGGDIKGCTPADWLVVGWFTGPDLPAARRGLRRQPHRARRALPPVRQAGARGMEHPAQAVRGAGGDGRLPRQDRGPDGRGLHRAGRHGAGDAGRRRRGDRRHRPQRDEAARAGALAGGRVQLARRRVPPDRRSPRVRPAMGRHDRASTVDHDEHSHGVGLPVIARRRSATSTSRTPPASSTDPRCRHRARQRRTTSSGAPSADPIKLVLRAIERRFCAPAGPGPAGSRARCPCW